MEQYGPNDFRHVFESVGRPVTVTSLALCLGFLVLVSANLKNQAEFGMLTAATLAFAWIVDVLLTPVIAFWAERTRDRRRARS